MTRRLAIVWRLAVCMGLLADVGCSPKQGPAAGPGQKSAAKQSEGPAAKTGDAPETTPLTLDEQALSLWQRDIDQYRRSTKDPQAIRAQAEEFLRTVHLSMLPRARGPDHAKTVEMGKKLLEQGSQDPLVKAYYGKTIFRDERAFEALLTLSESLNGWAESGYPGECRRMAIFTLFSEAKSGMQVNQWPQLRKEAVHLAAMRVGDTTIPREHRRLVFYELRPLLGDDCTKSWEDAAAIHEACSQQPNADPWILHLLAGRAYMSRAWHHRGGGWAYKVTPEGWKLFGENMKKAAQEFTAADKLHPENPEAAAFMIAVAMAGNSDETPYDWFDKAVAAELDYMPAYDQLRWALRPRWGGSHKALYDFGCRCADTERYDTQVPFVLLQVLDNIDDELGHNCQAWQRKGVYKRVKQVLEGMANDPSREDKGGVHPKRAKLMGLHVALAERSGEYKEARRLADALGDHFDRELFDRWCAHPEFVLANIYTFTGKGAEHVTSAWSTLNAAPKPYSDEVLKKAIDLFKKGLAADDHARSKAHCRARVAEMEGRLEFSAGKWYEKKFDPTLLAWLMPNGIWSQESENTAVGHARGRNSRVLVRPSFVPLFPMEIEFDVQVSNPPSFPLSLGLFLQEAGRTGVEDKIYHKFFIRTQDNQAGIEIGGKSKTVPCSLKTVNRLRVRIAEGRAVLYVNDQLCVDRSEEDFHPQAPLDFGCHDYLYPHMLVRVSNVRIHKWEPPKKEAAPKQPTPKKELPAEKMAAMTILEESIR